MRRCAAGIVLYHPDLKRLKQNIDSIYTQVERVYCYNNGLEDEVLTDKLLQMYDNIVVLGEGKNKGIATALEEIMKAAEKEKYEWVLTLDQDSVSPAHMIDTFLQSAKEKNVGVICPVMYDSRRKNEKSITACKGTIDVDFCITSGAFTNVTAWKAIGGFDETLFIGLVDNEFCYRIRRAGYRIIQVQSMLLDHELGNLTPSRHEMLYLKLGDILHSETIKKLSYKRAVSPMRLYYATRNMVYLNKKYPKNSIPDWSSRMLVKNSLSNLARGSNKGKILKAIRKGISDGRKLPIA